MTLGGGEIMNIERQLELLCWALLVLCLTLGGVLVLCVLG